MILNIRSLERIYNDKVFRHRRWHQWFAWYPRRISSEKIIWLQKIYRRKVDYQRDWQYCLTDPTIERHEHANG